MISSGLDEAAQCQAVSPKDGQHDSLSYFAAKDARVYHRSTCAALRLPGEQCSFFSSMQSAKLRGLVACKYCHPTRLNSGLSTKILSSIAAGAIDDKGVGGLAHALHISEQHLRRIVRDKTGASPKQLNNERRLKTAKRLTVRTNLPITEVAFSAGFSSIRQFNDEFKKAFKTSPREMRRAASLVSPVRSYMILLWMLRRSL